MTLVQMKDVIPYTNYTSALEALDNGGRFYNLFTKADDEEISLEIFKRPTMNTDLRSSFRPKRTARASHRRVRFLRESRAS